MNAPMGKDTKKEKVDKPKEAYRVSNWSAYNQSLKNRGSLTVWLSDDLEQWWYFDGTQKPGGEIVYSDRAIEFCLTIKHLLQLPYRQTEGFISSLLQLSGFKVEVPSYSQMNRRSKSLGVDMKVRKRKKESLQLVIDSTGLKVYGEGEWKVRKHGWSKYRTWRKLHVASDGMDLEIISLVLTTNQTDDAQGGKEVMKQVDCSLESIAGDGAYDKRTFRGCLPKGVPQLIPPRRDAVDSKGRVSEYDQRDEAVKRIKETSREEWKKEVGYHIRSKSEVNMYRYKVTFGERMNARKLPFEKTEVRIKAKILNQFVELGMPKSYKVAS
jgi:hypothetical protein